MVAEDSIPESERFYCPKPQCSALLVVLPEDRGRAGAGAAPVACLACGASLCIKCCSLWHAGLSCAQYQVGGPELKPTGPGGWRSCSPCSPP